jgi:hypothetical protein
MEDTTAEVRAIVYNSIMARSEEERFLMCAEMFEMTKKFAEARLPAGLTQDERKRRVFKEIYGFDLPEDTKQ